MRHAVEPAVAAVFGVSVRALRAATRGSRRTAFARQVAMYLAHVVLGLSLTEVGAIFARDRTTVAHACAMVEDERDDPELDARLDHLERDLLAGGCAVRTAKRAMKRGRTEAPGSRAIDKMPPQGDGSEAFRAQHQIRRVGETDIDGARRPILLNEAKSPLGWLKSRKDRNGRPLISAEQFEAGERLRADYCFAHLPQRVTSSWSAPAPSIRARRGAPSNPAALRDKVIAAKERVIRALMAVGPEVSGMLVDICCELKGLEEAEKESGWPARAGKVVSDRADAARAALRPAQRRAGGVGAAPPAALGQRGLPSLARRLAREGRRIGCVRRAWRSRSRSTDRKARFRTTFRWPEID